MRVDIEGAGYLYHLLLRHGQRTRLGHGIDFDGKGGEALARTPLHRCDVKEPEVSAQFAPKEEVRPDRKIVGEVQFLVYRGCGACERDGSRCRTEHPEDALDQRRFPGAVLTYHAKDLATAKLQRKALQHLVRAVRLTERIDPKDRPSAALITAFVDTPHLYRRESYHAKGRDASEHDAAQTVWGG